MKIYIEAKQVGKISHMTKSLSNLINILKSGQIYASKRDDKNRNTGKMQHYVCFSRDLTSAHLRNPKRWGYGVIIDGNILSNDYPIEPNSFVGNVLTPRPGNKSYHKCRVRKLTAYDNNTYTLTCENWPTIEISQRLYKKIQSIIESEVAERGLKVSHTYKGIQSYRGRTVAERYSFGRYQGIILNSDLLDGDISVLSKHPKMNETEERIWLPKGVESVDILNSIVGIIMPKRDKDSDDKDVKEALTCFRNIVGDDYMDKVLYI